MAYYAYATVLTKANGVVITTSSTLGYAEATSDDEARGIAIRVAMEVKPGFNVAQVNVVELKGLVAEVYTP